MLDIYDEIGVDMLIIFHAGDEIKPIDHIQTTPERLARVKKVFPQMKMIAAHLGGFRLWDEVEEYLLGEDIYFDVSYTSGHLGSKKIVQLIKEHGVDRILFGTDFPFRDQKKEIGFILNLDLTDDEKHLILGENAQGLLCSLEKNLFD